MKKVTVTVQVDGGWEWEASVDTDLSGSDIVDMIPKGWEGSKPSVGEVAAWLQDLSSQTGSGTDATAWLRIIHHLGRSGDTEQRLAELAAEWGQAKYAAAKWREQLLAEVLIASAEGMSEYAIARATGVTRMTVRDWLGKRT